MDLQENGNTSSEDVQRPKGRQAEKERKGGGQWMKRGNNKKKKKENFYGRNK